MTVIPCQYLIHNKLFCFGLEERRKRHIRGAVWFQEEKERKLLCLTSASVKVKTFILISAMTCIRPYDCDSNIKFVKIKYLMIQIAEFPLVFCSQRPHKALIQSLT